MEFLKNSKFWKVFIPLFAILCVVITIILCVQVYGNKNNSGDKGEEKVSDSVLIKKEYEDYNDKKNDSDISYVNVSLPDNNSLIYASEDGIKKLFENGSGVLFLGNAESNEARNVIGVLNDAIMSTSVPKIFYYDIVKIRSKVFIENDKVVVDKGTDFYYYLLEKLDEYLSPNYYVDNNGKEIQADEKIILDSTVVFINEGKVVDYHIGCGKDDINTSLTEEERKNLLSELLKGFEKIVEECDSNC